MGQYLRNNCPNEGQQMQARLVVVIYDLPVLKHNNAEKIIFGQCVTDVMFAQRPHRRIG